METRDSKFWDFGSVPMIEPEYLGSILAAASDIALFVKLNGNILSILVNESEKSLGNLSHWEGRQISDFLTRESNEKLDVVLNQINSGQSVLHSVELNHQDNALWQFPVRYSIHRLGAQDTILMLGRDLRTLAETQQQLVQAQIAVERRYEESRRYDTQFRMLMSHTRDAIMFVSVAEGKIIEANAGASNLLGLGAEELEGTDFATLFEGVSKNELMTLLVEKSELSMSPELPTLENKSGQTIHIYPYAFRSAGERLLYCRLDVEEENSPSQDELSKNLLSLYQNGPDAIVFAQSNGVIEAANDGFLDLINAPSLSKVRGRSLANYLTRGQIDLAVMLDNVVRSGQMRIYATELQNELGSKLSVEVSVARLGTIGKRLIAFVIRDAHRSETMRQISPSGHVQPETSVAELVGSASLKEIVGETNDMIEKMCIETAIEMTNNNRAAAAEMLGLSRQSLYVKLRKFGLISKEQDF